MDLASIDLTSADAVIDAFERGARANIHAGCRKGAIDEISGPGRLIATGDLHDNPIHFVKLLEAANMGPDPSGEPCHITLHEIIHSDRLVHDMDFSHRALARVAALKAEYPEHVHALLANHELAQLVGSPVLKDGIKCLDAFDDALDHAFGDRREDVDLSLKRFIRSMPLALRVHARSGDFLCAHSLPGPAMMARFDPGILSRDLENEDYAPRQGSAHLMVWGRGYDHEQLEDLVERWGVTMFILGHEHADNGATLVEPNAVVLNSDHARGVYLPIDLDNPPSPVEAMERLVSLAG